MAKNGVESTSFHTMDSTPGGDSTANGFDLVPSLKLTKRLSAVMFLLQLKHVYLFSDGV